MTFEELRLFFNLLIALWDLKISTLYSLCLAIFMVWFLSVVSKLLVWVIDGVIFFG